MTCDYTTIVESTNKILSEADQEMTKDRTRCGGHGVDLEDPHDWPDDEINRDLTITFRSCVDQAFTRGERPT